MKKFILWIVFLFSCTLLMGQPENHWTGSVSASWTVNANWSLNHPPASGEIAFFDNGPSNKNITQVPSTTIAGIHVTASASYTFTGSAGGNLLTVNGNVQIDAGCSLNATITTGSEISLEVTGSASVTINGSLTTQHLTLTSSVSASVTATGSVTIKGSYSHTSSAAVTLNGSMIFIGSSGSFSGTATVAGSGSVTVNAGRTLTVDGNLTVSSGFSHSGILTINTSRTLTVDGTFTASGSASFSGSGSILINVGRTMTMDGTVTVSGTLVISGGGTVCINTGKSVTVDGNVTVSTSVSHSGLLIVNASKTLTVSGAFTTSVSGSFDGNGTIDITGGTTVTVDGNATVSGNLHVTGGGHFQVNTGRSLTVSGDFDVDSFFDVYTDVSVDASRTLTIGGTCSASTGACFEGSGNIVIAGGKVMSIDGSASLCGTISISGGGSVQVNAGKTLTVDGNITVNTAFSHSGILNVDVTRTLTVNGSFTAQAGSSVHVYGSLKGSGSLTLTNGNTTIHAGGQISLSGSASISSNSGNLTLEANASGYASLVCGGSVTCTGTITVQVYLSKNQWHFISTPVSGATAYVFLNDYLSYYKEETGLWVPITTNDPLEDLRGYEVWKPTTSAGTEQFEGPVHNGVMPPHTLTRTFLDPDYNGWNLVGNPYPCSVNLQTSTGWSWTHVDQTAYFWDGTFGGGGGGGGRYASWTWGSYPGGTNGGSEHVPSMQAFFVHVSPPETSGSFQVWNEAREEVWIPFWKNSQSNPNCELRLWAGIDTNDLDELVVRFIQSSTPDFDGEYDAYKLFGNQPVQLYARTADNIKTAMNSVPVSSAMTIVPVSIKASLPGTYLLTARQLNSFSPGTGIFLEDLKKNIIQDLMTDSLYAFSVDSSDNPDRFVLLFTDVYTGGQGVSTTTPVRIYSCGKSVFICSDPSLGRLCNVTMYDMLGRKITEDNHPNEASFILNFNLTNGYYLVKATAGDRSVVQKVLLIN